MTNADEDCDSQAQRLERMRNEFLAAQQRRRELAAGMVSSHDDTGNGPPVAGPAAGDQIATQPRN